MKKYSVDFKLNESVGFERIERNKTYTTKSGGKVIIKDIYIDANSMIPDTYVVYDFESSTGEKVQETNRFTVLVDLIRNT